MKYTSLSDKPVNNSFPDSLVNFDQIPDSGFVRLPVVKRLYGVSAATVWRSVKNGLIPQPVRLSARVTGWNVGLIRADLKSKGAK